MSEFLVIKSTEEQREEGVERLVDTAFVGETAEFQNNSCYHFFAFFPMYSLNFTPHLSTSDRSMTQTKLISHFFKLVSLQTNATDFPC